MKDQILVPCGKCDPCRVARSHEWATRMMHELLYHEASSFLTLTYDDDHLPDDYSVSKRHLTLFLKRLRRNVEPHRIRYYACAEYGEINSRPHYHLICFGLPVWAHTTEPANSGYMALAGPAHKSWDYGFVNIDTVSIAVCRYISNYIQKDRLRCRRFPSLEPPFQRQSSGIGKAYYHEHKEQLYRDMGIKHHGKLHALPRYYQKLMKKDYGELNVTKRLERIGKLRREENAAKILKPGQEPNAYDWLLHHARQEGRNIRAKERLRSQKI